MVQKAMQYIDETPDLDTRIELIQTLSNVSAGKVDDPILDDLCHYAYLVDWQYSSLVLINYFINSQIYVEIERARLIKRLAKIKEEQGLIAEAADLMQEIAVS